MPSKRREQAQVYSHEKILLERIESDIRTIPDQTFGKVYSTQIVMIEPDILKKKRVIKRKRISRK